MDHLQSQKYTREKFERSGIPILKERRDGECEIHCIFSSCDQDSKGKEAHLSVNFDKGVFYCFKCGSKGHISELFKYLNLVN